MRTRKRKGNVPRSKKRQDLILKILATTTVAIGATVAVAPLVWMLSTSLKSAGRVLLLPPEWIPRPVVWKNYLEAFDFMNGSRVYLNTIIVTGSCMIGQLISSTLVGFGFARIQVPGRDALFLLVLSSLMLPYQVTLIPQFILFRKVGWIDTLWPLIVPAFAGGPFMIFLVRQFFLSIPMEMDDAARIDGCGYFAIYWRIILPMSKPVLGVVAIQTFMNNWNDFMRPLIFLHSSRNYTVALALRSFSSDYGMTPWHLLMAASLTALAPCIVLFFVAQRYFIQGIVITGVKG
jgi:multiple sugar transport system permease protein